MDRSQHIIAYDAFRNDNGILIVISFPRNISNQKIPTQSNLSILRGITFGKDITSLHPFSLATDRSEVDGHILVGAPELRNTIFFQCRFKTNKLLIFRTVIKNADGSGINILDNAIAFSRNHRTRVLTYLLLQTGAYDGGVVVKQRNSLAHHVTSHQCAVTIVMLQERNQTGRD